MVVLRIIRYSLIPATGIAGYLFGRHHEKTKVETRNDLPGIPVFPKIYAASSIAESNLSQVVGNNLPEIKNSQIVGNSKESSTAPARISQIMKYGFPSLDNIRSFDDFVLSYDRRNRVANWVFEHLTRDIVKVNKDVDRSKCNFFEDESVHPYFRSRNSDYKGSGFDRGHLAAAGNHKANQKNCEQTFVLSNMAPQVGDGFNRDSWNRLEKYVRKLTKTYPNVYVCTGPLYLPRVESDGKTYIKYQVIGASTVAVPTHFFKVIVMENSDSTFDMEAYVMPNQPISDDTPLTVFQVPPDSIERASGLLFFDRLPKNKIKKINGKSGKSPWLNPVLK